jgi:hypothetical protein
MSAIQRQPAVHLEQIAKFLPLRDLANCQKMCTAFRDHLVVPVAEWRHIPTEEINEDYYRGRQSLFVGRLRSAVKFGRVVNLKLLFDRNIQLLDPYSAAPGIRLLAFEALRFLHLTPGDINPCCAPLLRSSPHLREVTFPYLTPEVATTLAESCPNLSKIIANVTYIAAIPVLARCPHLTEADLSHPVVVHHDSSSELTHLQSLILRRWALNDDSLRGLLPSTLRSLRLETCPGLTAAREPDVLRQLPFLESYQSGDVTDAVLEALPPQIHTFKAELSTRFTDEGLLHFAATHPSLTSLHILYCISLSIPILQRLGQARPNLRHLSVLSLAPHSKNDLIPLVTEHFKSLRTLKYTKDKEETVEGSPHQTLAQKWSQS